MMDEHCIFCKIIKGIIPSKKYFENDSFLAFFDINPISKNHIVFISKNHYENLNEMPDSEWQQFIVEGRVIAEKLVKEINADGYNLMINQGRAADSVVNHRPHMHIIPRYFNDNLKIDPRN